LLKKRTESHAAKIQQELTLALQGRAQAEEGLAAIREENERLKTRFDLIRQATSDGLWDMETNQSNQTDADNPFWWSDQFRHLLGFRDEEDFPNVLGSWASRLHPEDSAPTLAAFNAHINDCSGQTPYDVTYRLLCRSGEYRWFRARGNTMRTSDGTALRVAGSLTDLTDRNAILGLKRYAEDILANLPAGLIVADGALRVLSVNDTFRGIFGLKSEDDVVGHELDALLPQPWLREQAQGVLADGTTLHGIDVALGEKRLRVAIAGIRLAQDDRRLLIVAEDVTEEQRLREEALAHAARYREQASLLDKATDAIAVHGIDDQILFWNKGAERLYGWTPEEAMKISPDELTWDDPVAFRNVTNRVLDHGEWRGEVAQRRKDGSALVVDSQRTLVLDANSQPRSILIINTDITQRKLADLELARTNRALRMLSRCNEALTRMDDEVELLLQVCRLAVDEGGYRMAWVGFAQEDEALSIVPMAHAGHEEGYLSSVRLTWDAEQQSGCGPAGQAIRSGQAKVSEDIAQGDNQFYRHEEAMRQGYRSAVFLPLRDASRTFGLLALYSASVEKVGADEIKLLQDMADNLAFGIGNIRSRRERRRIEETVLKVAAGVSATVGTKFFEQLMRNTTEALGADAGFVVRLLPGEPMMARIIAGVVAGQPVSNFDYLLEDTPCLNLMQSGGFVVYSNVRARFPCSMPALFVDAEAYAGRLLEDAAGQPIGMFFVLFREPLKLTELIESTLQIFASRAAAELERLQADAKVREQASILDSAQNAIVIRDLQHKILYWNQGAERLYRWTAAEALGQSVLGLMHHPADFSRAMDQLLATGEWAGELRQVDHDGLPLAVEGHWTLVHDDLGAPTSVLAINTDIRERKQAQEEILRLNAGLEERVRQRTTQLQAANQELESFSYSVSHDLRTPLSTIAGFSQLLAKVDGNNVSEKGKHYLNRICAGAKQMGELIEGLLSLAQLNHGQIKLENVDLSAIAKQVEQACREREPERQVQVHIQEGLHAHGDPRLLSAVLQNLLGNAWKFTAKQALARIEFCSKLGADGDTIFFVKDNGAGFDMAFVDKLFGTFQRLHSHEEFSGTGVGLATVKRIIGRHEGRVWAESKLNEGATVYFTLGKLCITPSVVCLM
jgi:PAS domain S-box-containing protein